MIEDPLTKWSDMSTFKFSILNALFIFSVDVILYPTELLTTRIQANKV